MKKTLLLIVTCVLALLSSCKPNPNETTNITGVEYYYIQRYSGKDNVIDVRYGGVMNPHSWDYFIIVNDSIRCVQVDVDLQVDQEGNYTYTEYYFVSDYYRSNDNEMVLGTHVRVNNKITPCDTLICPYWEFNGVKHDIQMPIRSKGKGIIERNGDYYFIIEDFSDGNDNYTYYLSKNGETPVRQFELVGHGKKIRKTRLMEDQLYFVGEYYESPFFITTGESLTRLCAYPDGGYVYDACWVDGIEHFFGTKNNVACEWVDGVANVLPSEVEGVSSSIKCIQQVGDDIYMGGNVGGDPAIWKNGELIARFTGIDRSHSFSAGPNGIVTVYKNAAVCDIEVVGDKIYSAIQLITENVEMMFAAAVWDLSVEPVEVEMMYELKDILKENDVTYSEIDPKRYWFSNTPDYGVNIWNANYSMPRINIRR
ncbi:MAG: hypothetical protein Q4D14_03795 [Bacteroidales bacterium]|nr:hypothetical protein [Bacteroidales bacterium]